MCQSSRPPLEDAGAMLRTRAWELPPLAGASGCSVP